VSMQSPRLLSTCARVGRRLLRHVGLWLLWVLVFVLLVDHRDWRLPWNWWLDDLFEDLACATPAGLAAESNETTSLKVVLPSAGQTGTTSLIVALQMMGLRSYHIEEHLAYMRPTLLHEVSLAAYARQVSKCRVDALSIEPMLDLTDVVFRTSPDAKFVMTWRDYPSWVQSTNNGGGLKDVRWFLIMSLLVTSSLRMLPWLSLWDWLTGEFSTMIKEGEPFSSPGQSTLSRLLAFHTYYKHVYGKRAAFLFIRGTNKISSIATDPGNFSEEAYVAHVDEIRRLVPPERLLEFDVRRHGFPELSKFLDLPAPSGRLPHPRSKDSFSNDPSWDQSPRWMRAAFLAIAFTAHVVNFEALRWCLRRVAACVRPRPTKTKLT